MLSFDNPKWALLNHAYGLASDTPDLLMQLSLNPHCALKAEPWHSLWSSLAHQGDVYDATFAALPHIIRIAEKNISTIDGSFFQFTAWVEICRKAKNITIPSELAKPYFETLLRIPSLVALSADREWNANFMQSALSAIAASKGQTAIAEALLELTPGVSSQFMEWYYDR